MSSFISSERFKKDFVRKVFEDKRAVMVESHSLRDPFKGTVYIAMLTRPEITVTNERRDWFALIERMPDGTLRVR